jgi:NADPH2:quinone reductase
MVSYGAISGDLPEVPSSALFALKSVTGVGLLAWRTARPDEARNDITEVTQLWQSGVLRPAIHARFPLAEAARLHKILDDRANLGRLVATV